MSANDLPGEENASEENAAYSTLQDAQPPFVEVHDWVVDAFPVVDDLVVVYSGNNIDGWVVAPFADTLIRGLLRVPAVCAGEIFLSLPYETQEFNVSTREQVETTVDVDNALAKTGTCPSEELRKCALLLRIRLDPGFGRGGPEPNINARGLAGLVRRVQLHPLRHGLAFGLDLIWCAMTLLATQSLFKRLNEVRAGAEKHSADQVRRGYAGRALNDLESTSSLDEAVAVLTVAVRSDVVAMDDVLAPIMCDPVQLRDIGGSPDGLRHPAAGVDSG